MAYRKLEKPAGLIEAKTRHQAMQNLDNKEGAPVEYGHTSSPLNTGTVAANITEIERAIAAHNQFLQDADEIKNSIQEKVKALNSLHSRVLKAAVGRFGENHSYVELLGGTRKAERKRPLRKPKTS